MLHPNELPLMGSSIPPSLLAGIVIPFMLFLFLLSYVLAFFIMYVTTCPSISAPSLAIPVAAC